MPTYEYRCKDCSEHLEVVHSFNDDALTVCPACGGGLRKVFGNIGITFKGSGFYRTDSRGGTRRSDASTSSESSAGSTGSEKSDKSSEKSDKSSDKKSDSASSSSSSASSSSSSGSTSTAAAATA